MSREEMLSALGQLNYSLIWPGDWDDVGFTEREIWVNDKGYGFIMCDEPTQYWHIPGIDADKWARIKSAFNDSQLTFADIKETPLKSMIEGVGLDVDECNSSDLCNILRGLVLADYATRPFYAMSTIDGIEYYDTEESFKAAFERDWADVYWKDLSDEMLTTWLNRLKKELGTL